LSCLKTLPRFGGAFYSYRAAVARWPAARITLRQGASTKAGRGRVNGLAVVDWLRGLGFDEQIFGAE